MGRKTNVQGRRVDVHNKSGRVKKSWPIKLTPQKRAKPRWTMGQIIGLLGSLATVAAFIWSLATSPDSGGQNANVQAGDNSQVNVNQTKDGDINNYFGSIGEAIQPTNPLEDLPEEPGPEWLACAYDLVQEGRQTGNFDKAKRTIREMVKATDMDLQSRCILQYNLGLACGYSGENGAAQVAFQEAVKGGSFPDAFYSLGLTYVNDESEKAVKDYSKAIEAFTRAIQGKEKPEYYLSRAKIYEEMGLLDEADQDREAAQRLTAIEQ